MAKSTKNGKMSSEKTAKKRLSPVAIDKSTPHSYVSTLLWCAMFLDTVVMLSPAPSVTLHSIAGPRTLEGLVLFQLVFFLPQLGTTLLAERAGKRIGGMYAYAATLLATSASTFVTAKALREHSVLLYFAGRFLAGVLRHVVTLGALAWNELPAQTSKEQMMTAKLFGLPFSLIIGGILADFTPDVSVVLEIMGFVELATAVLVGALSLWRERKPKTLPLVQSAAAYKVWLRRQPYRRFAAFLPMALLALSASFVQCMYPYNHRLLFHLPFTLVGAHMAAVGGLQILSSRVVNWFGSIGQQKLMRICFVPFVFGTWISGWLERQGDVIFYMFCTFFLVDLPYSVLSALFGSIISQRFSKTERAYLLKALFHLQMIIKTWVTVLLNMTVMSFESYGRADGQQLIAVSCALGFLSFVKFQSVLLTLGTFIGSLALLSSIPPLDDEKTVFFALEQFRSYVHAFYGYYNTRAFSR